MYNYQANKCLLIDIIGNLYYFYDNELHKSKLSINNNPLQIKIYPINKDILGLYVLYEHNVVILYHLNILTNKLANKQQFNYSIKSIKDSSNNYFIKKIDYNPYNPSKLCILWSNYIWQLYDHDLLIYEQHIDQNIHEITYINENVLIIDKHTELLCYETQYNTIYNTLPILGQHIPAQQQQPLAVSIINFQHDFFRISSNNIQIYNKKEISVPSLLLSINKLNETRNKIFFKPQQVEEEEEEDFEKKTSKKKKKLSIIISTPFEKKK